MKTAIPYEILIMLYILLVYAILRWIWSTLAQVPSTRASALEHTLKTCQCFLKEALPYVIFSSDCIGAMWGNSKKV